MFMRGQMGPCPQWLAELDVADEVAAIEERWIKPGKMLSWNMMPGGLRIIGPKFLGAGDDERLTLWFYTFPTLELFKEWALGAPEHVALHTKIVAAIAAADAPPPMYNFHATDDPDVDIPAIRAELKAMYQQIERTDWANMPSGSVQLMMLGEHD
ncbi:hypothetical protein [Segniliparus rugosus]|uniref:Uncharacterized protein n=1 Tax=Segniliparus rugosus (strain ATCC BAA-974 / DSM 45345 / CCUG 50838 / CIP 108380 / JCM 13579 / CDC 945) TaxID=679197 RepID=E5XPA2_SEGRC|nr:hypothetical protein [Segniliparus rugosus]EFV13827.1 hypothetical protein HMPREF9336_01324 [Segniliparus rugosus ATCC BAA-974]